MAAYDPSVILAFADKLYQQAAGVEGAYTMAGVLVGALIGAVLGGSFAGSSLMGAIIAAVILGAIAWQIGRQKAAALRLQAQVALCQVQIEANTRYLRNT
jgi:F0F1-type ATP synthase assembly protein I